MKHIGEGVMDSLEALLGRVGSIVENHKCSECGEASADIFPGSRCQKCHDLSERRRRLMLESLQLPEVYRDALIKNIENVGNIIHVKLALETASNERLGGAAVEKPGVFLTGSVGAGKTLLTAAHFRRFVWKGLPARWIRMVDLLSLIRQTYAPRSKVTDGDVISTMSYYATAGVLMIDDIGAERSTDWVVDKLYDLIDRISGAKGCLWLTSNLTFDELEGMYGERVVDRIVGLCRPILLEAPSYRLRRVG